MTELEKSRFANWLLEHPDASLPEAVRMAGDAAAPMDIVVNFLAAKAIADKDRECLKQVFCQAFDDVVHGQMLLELMAILVRLYRERETGMAAICLL